jgi:osmotically-inducible protein OsmY
VANNISELRLGCRVRFQDRWAGQVDAVEVDESWEVLNVVVRHGFPRTSTVRLPLNAATGWSGDYLAFDEITSVAAFGRELPPIAAPSRPISRQTPMATGNLRLAALMVDNATRRVRAVLARHGGTLIGVPAEGVTFEGKVMHLGVQPDAFVTHFNEDELRERVREGLAADRELTPGESHYVEVEVVDGNPRLTGNVRTKQSRESVHRCASAALGMAVNVEGLFDDMQLETEIGLAMERAGLTRGTEVYIRCTLGAAVLFGYAPSQAVADQAVLTASRVPGVREVASQIEIGPGSRVPVA